MTGDATLAHLIERWESGGRPAGAPARALFHALERQRYRGVVVMHKGKVYAAESCAITGRESVWSAEPTEASDIDARGANDDRP